jgi:hypothetical protein
MSSRTATALECTIAPLTAIAPRSTRDTPLFLWVMHQTNLRLRARAAVRPVNEAVVSRPLPVVIDVLTGSSDKEVQD